MLREIDDFVLDHFENVSHWLQRTFGVRSVRCAHASLIISAGFLVRHFAVGDIAGRVMAIFMLIIIGLLIFFSTMADHFRNEGHEVFMNSAREELWRWRLYMLCTLPLASYKPNSFDGFMFCFVISAYFLAVTDLPAAPSRFRKRLDLFSVEPMEAVTNE